MDRHSSSHLYMTRTNESHTRMNPHTFERITQSNESHIQTNHTFERIAHSNKSHTRTNPHTKNTHIRTQKYTHLHTEFTHVKTHNFLVFSLQYHGKNAGTRTRTNESYTITSHDTHERINRHKEHNRKTEYTRRRVCTEISHTTQNFLVFSTIPRQKTPDAPPD
jgi:hypothetical protein